MHIRFASSLRSGLRSGSKAVNVAVTSSIAVGVCVLQMATAASAYASESTSLSPTVGSMSFDVTPNGGVSGARSLAMGVTHSDDRTFCAKIYEVVISTPGGAVLGSKRLTNPLCNFNPNDASVNVTPLKDSELAAKCTGRVGQTLPVDVTVRTCLNQTSTSFDPLQLPGTQVNVCGAPASGTINVSIHCVAAPPPAGTAVAPPAANTVGAVPVINTTTSTPSSPASPKVTTTLASGGVAANPKQQVGKQDFKVDPSMFIKIATITAPAADKAAIDADYNKVSAAYAGYTATLTAFNTKYQACMNKTYTPAEQLASCAATDYAVDCATKLVATCDKAELAALTTARATLHSTTAALSTSAQKLSTQVQ